MKHIIRVSVLCFVSIACSSNYKEPESNLSGYYQTLEQYEATETTSISQLEYLHQNFLLADDLFGLTRTSRLLSAKYAQQELEKAIEYGHQAKRYADIIGHRKSQFDANIQLFYLTLDSEYLAQARSLVQDQYDMNLLAYLSEDYNSIMLLSQEYSPLEQAYTLYWIGKRDKNPQSVLRAQNLFSSVGAVTGLIDSHFLLARLYQTEQRMKLAKEHGRRALEIAIASNSTSLAQTIKDWSMEHAIAW